MSNRRRGCRPGPRAFPRKVPWVGIDGFCRPEDHKSPPLRNPTSFTWNVTICDCEGAEEVTCTSYTPASWLCGNAGLYLISPSTRSAQAREAVYELQENCTSVDAVICAVCVMTQEIRVCGVPVLACYSSSAPALPYLAISLRLISADTESVVGYMAFHIQAIVLPL